MIRVTVTLISAISRDRDTELARMDICNLGDSENPRRGNYSAESYVGRDSAALDKRRVSKSATITNWPRLDFHIWNLVRRALDEMGYTNGRS